MGNSNTSPSPHRNSNPLSVEDDRKRLQQKFNRVNEKDEKRVPQDEEDTMYALDMYGGGRSTKDSKPTGTSGNNNPNTSHNKVEGYEFSTLQGYGDNRASFFDTSDGNNANQNNATSLTKKADAARVSSSGDRKNSDGKVDRYEFSTLQGYGNNRASFSDVNATSASGDGGYFLGTQANASPAEKKPPTSGTGAAPTNTAPTPPKKEEHDMIDDDDYYFSMLQPARKGDDAKTDKPATAGAAAALNQQESSGNYYSMVPGPRKEGDGVVKQTIESLNSSAKAYKRTQQDNKEVRPPSYDEVVSKKPATALAKAPAKAPAKTAAKTAAPATHNKDHNTGSLSIKTDEDAKNKKGLTYAAFGKAEEFINKINESVSRRKQGGNADSTRPTPNAKTAAAAKPPDANLTNESSMPSLHRAPEIKQKQWQYVATFITKVRHIRDTKLQASRLAASRRTGKRAEDLEVEDFDESISDVSSVRDDDGNVMLPPTVSNLVYEMYEDHQMDMEPSGEWAHIPATKINRPSDTGDMPALENDASGNYYAGPYSIPKSRKRPSNDSKGRVHVTVDEMDALKNDVSGGYDAKKPVHHAESHNNGDANAASFFKSDSGTMDGTDAFPTDQSDSWAPECAATVFKNRMTTNNTAINRPKVGDDEEVKEDDWIDKDEDVESAEEEGDYGAVAGRNFNIYAAHPAPLTGFAPPQANTVHYTQNRMQQLQQMQMQQNRIYQQQYNMYMMQQQQQQQQAGSPYGAEGLQPTSPAYANTNPRPAPASPMSPVSVGVPHPQPDIYNGPVLRPFAFPTNNKWVQRFERMLIDAQWVDSPRDGPEQRRMARHKAEPASSGPDPMEGRRRPKVKS